MTLKHWLAAAALLPGLCLTELPARAQQQSGDSVADAARKAREQQKAAQKPKKVFTNDDFKSATPAPSSSSSTGSSGSSQATDNTKGAASTTGTSTDDAEKAWKQRFSEQRAKIAQAQQELDVLQREQSKAQVQYYSDPTKAMNEQYSRKDLNDKQNQIDLKKKQIADLQQQLSDMEDELRKSGGDPGWARE